MKAFIIFPNQHWVRSCHYSWEDPVNLTAVPVTLSLALLVDTILETSYLHKSSHPDKVIFVEGELISHIDTSADISLNFTLLSLTLLPLSLKCIYYLHMKTGIGMHASILKIKTIFRWLFWWTSERIMWKNII